MATIVPAIPEGPLPESRSVRCRIRPGWGARLEIAHHVADGVRPRSIIITSEIKGLPGEDAARSHIVDLVGEAQDEPAYPIDPGYEHLVGTELASDVEIAAVAVVQVALL